MDCGIGNTNLLGSSSSVLGYDCFYMKSTDGATMYFNLGSGIGDFKLIIETLKIFFQSCYQFVSDQRGCGPSCHLFRALEPT